MTEKGGTWKGHLYELALVDTSFRATGLDAAHRVARRLNEVVREALESDPDVISVESGPWHKERASALNFVSGDSQKGR